MATHGPHTSSNEKQYFIAIVPPEPIYREALLQKQYFKDHYNSKASLNSPPHITLHMPFKWNEQKESVLTEQLEEFSNEYPALSIRFDNFSSFPPKVIFINVMLTKELENLQQSLHRYCKRALNLFNANYKELAFHPHLTVAFRDLKKTAYHQAWEEFQVKKFQSEFVADNLCLLKHTGRIWQVHQHFNLKKPY